MHFEISPNLVDEGFQAARCLAPSMKSVIGQVATEAKSNEITAIPELVDRIDVQGAIVTIDAMGCQREIARKIIHAGGDYVLAVKDNQPSLHEVDQGGLQRRMAGRILQAPALPPRDL